VTILLSRLTVSKKKTEKCCEFLFENNWKKETKQANKQNNSENNPAQ